MGKFLGSIAVGYLTACGTVTVACVVGRGLLRVAELATHGELQQAGESILATAVAPALMAYNAVNLFTGEVIETAGELSKSFLSESTSQPNRDSPTA